MKYTYLLIDLFSVLVPFLLSFHPKIKFYKNWPAIFPAMLITGSLFIGWDMYFTHLRIWGFNPAYLIGIYIGNLPLEEMLFFLCIPYACVFTYHCLHTLIQKTISKKVEMVVSCVLLVASVLLAAIFRSLNYTAYTFALLALLIFGARLIRKVQWLPAFYLTYLILLVPFLIVNGLLTGTGLHSPVVWYDSTQILNVRILTIPVEDVFYGMDLILLNMLIYSWIGKRSYLQNKMRRKTIAGNKFKLS